MKKIHLLFLFIVFAFTALSQPKFHAPLLQPDLPQGIVMPSNSIQSTLSSFRMDYNAREIAISNSIPGSHYGYFIWPMNSRYTGVDSAWKYCMVAYDSIYNYQDSTGYGPTSVSSLTLDSLELTAGHENNSGLMDSIIAKIVTVDNYGYPTNTVLWSDTIFTNIGLSIINNYLFNTTMKFYPGITIPGGKFAVKFEYYGALTDTFGFLAGYRYLTGTCNGSPNFNLGQITRFSKINAPAFVTFANSFAYWTQPGFNQVYPTPQGFNVYYDCDGVAGQSAADGSSYLQNINLGAYVTIDQSLGITVNHGTVICAGRQTTLNSGALGGVAPFHYQWSPTIGLTCDTCPITTAGPANTTVYTLTVTDASGSVSDTTTVNVVTNNVSSSFTASQNNFTVIYSNTSLNATNYLWTFGAGASPATSSSAGPVTVHYSTTGTKTVTLKATQFPSLCNDSSAQSIDVANVGLDRDPESGSFSLMQNTPNPFSDQTEISFELKTPQPVSLVITDVLGREVKAMKEKQMDTGIHTMRLNASEFSPGIYFYTLKAGGFSKTIKMTVEQR